MASLTASRLSPPYLAGANKLYALTLSAKLPPSPAPRTNTSGEIVSYTSGTTTDRTNTDISTSFYKQNHNPSLHYPLNKTLSGSALPWRRLILGHWNWLPKPDRTPAHRCTKVDRPPIYSGGTVRAARQKQQRAAQREGENII